MTAPQSASETSTQYGPNSDDLNTAAPFPFLVLNFLASYYKIGQQDGRMLMHAARAYDLKDSEALRWAKVVQQAENFCHNRNGEHKWHWAKNKADNYLIRVYEQWPDLKMHERLCRSKMALGGVATFFQYTGTQTDAEVALDDFIRTGLIPAPKPIPESTKEAVRLEDIAKRSAELETGEAEADKWFGPKKVSKAVTDSSNGKILGDYLKTQQSWAAWWTSAKNLCKANGIKEEDLDTHIHEVLLGPDYGTRSAKTYPGAPGDALGAIKDSFSKPKTKASENSANKPASAPVASTPVTEPAKDDKPQAQDIPAVETTKQEPLAEQPKALALVTAENSLPQGLFPAPSEWQFMRDMAQAAIKSGLLPKGIKSSDAALYIIETGRELGISPALALRKIQIIQGQPTLAAELMLALVKRSGLLDYISIEGDETQCTVTMRRRGESSYVERFTMDQARKMRTSEWDEKANSNKQISLADKFNWRTMPAVMLKWRAVSAACRTVFPDITLGIYTSEEMQDNLALNGNTADLIIEAPAA